MINRKYNKQPTTTSDMSQRLTKAAMFADKCSGIDIAYHSDWENIKGKHYCPNCYEVEIVNGTYNVKAKQL